MAKLGVIKSKPIKIKLKRKKFQDFALEEISRQINARFAKVKTELVRLVRQLVYEIVVLSEDANKIRQYGIPAWELGIPFGTQNDLIDAVAQRTADSALVRFGKIRRIGNEIGGKIGIFIVKKDFSDILGLPEATFSTENGDDLPILSWILQMGDNPIPLKPSIKSPRAAGYKVIYERGRGRSGGAYMEPTSNVSEFFKIDSSYSGTNTDNWLTRAFNNKSAESYFKGQIGYFLNSRVFN